VPLLLGDLPFSGAFAPASLARTRLAWASSREQMLTFLKDKSAFTRFEGSKRRLLRGTMETRGGADLDLFGRACWLLEPVGHGYECMRSGLTALRDPFLASSFQEPAAVEALTPAPGAPGDAPPPLAVAVLGAAHLPGVVAELQAHGFEPVEAPSRGWPKLPVPTTEASLSAAAAAPGAAGRKSGAAVPSARRGRPERKGFR